MHAKHVVTSPSITFSCLPNYGRGMESEPDEQRYAADPSICVCLVRCEDGKNKWKWA